MDAYVDENLHLWLVLSDGSKIDAGYVGVKVTPPTTTTYTVTFVDWDGTVLKTETVEEGNSATAPADPTRDGYTFIGWDKTFGNVTGNITVTAGYEEKYNVKFSFTKAGAAISGDTFILTLNVVSDDISKVDGLLAYSLTYDESKLEFLGFSDYGELVSSSTAKDNSIINNIINLGYSPAIVANGKICNLTFKVKDGVSVGTELTISMSASASKDRMPLAKIIAPSCTFQIESN